MPDKRRGMRSKEDRGGSVWGLMHLTSKQAFSWDSTSWSPPVTPENPSGFQMDQDTQTFK